MTTAYELEIRKQCPHAEIVFDLYHVVAKYGREVIDRVRVDQANQLRHDKPARKVLKSSRWLLLRNRRNLKPDQAVHLKELLAANRSLLCVYVLRDELKRLWFYRKPAWAQKAWEQWFEQAQQSGIAPLQRFAERLQGYWHGIVARCRYSLNTSIVEGINNTIKVVKRPAYGLTPFFDGSSAPPDTIRSMPGSTNRGDNFALSPFAAARLDYADEIQPIAASARLWNEREARLLVA